MKVDIFAVKTLIRWAQEEKKDEVFSGCFCDYNSAAQKVKKIRNSFDADNYKVDVETAYQLTMTNKEKGVSVWVFIIRKQITL